MTKHHHATLRKLVRKKQHKDFDGKIKGLTQLVVLKNPERVIWTNGKFLTVDDQTLINSVGGDYLVRKCLRKEPTIYNLQVRNNSLQVVSRTSTESTKERASQIRDILPESRLDLYPTTIQEIEDLRMQKIEDLRNNLRVIPISKDFKEYVSYIKKTFSDKKIEIFTNNKEHLFFYFFDNEKIKAVCI